MSDILFGDLFKQSKSVLKSKLSFVLIGAVIFTILLSILPQEENILYYELKNILNINTAVLNITLFILYFVFSFYYTFVLMIISKEAINGKDITIKECINIINSKLVKIFTTSITTSILIALLTLLLIVPGLIFGLYWMFAIYAVIFNDLTNGEARDYSKKLTKGRWWKVFFLLLKYSLFIFVIILLSSILGSVIFNSLLSEYLANIFLSLTIGFISMVLSFLGMIYYVGLYLKLEETVTQ